VLRLALLTSGSVSFTLTDVGRQEVLLQIAKVRAWPLRCRHWLQIADRMRQTFFLWLFKLLVCRQIQNGMHRALYE
jgi:hypothetical protein